MIEFALWLGGGALLWPILTWLIDRWLTAAARLIELPNADQHDDLRSSTPGSVQRQRRVSRTDA